MEGFHDDTIRMQTIETAHLQLHRRRVEFAALPLVLLRRLAMGSTSVRPLDAAHNRPHHERAGLISLALGLLTIQGYASGMERNKM